MRMSKQSRLHLPRVPARPGEAPDFSYVQLSAAGAVPRPEINARARDMLSLSVDLVRGALMMPARQSGRGNPGSQCKAKPAGPRHVTTRTGGGERPRQKPTGCGKRSCRNHPAQGQPVGNARPDNLENPAALEWRHWIPSRPKPVDGEARAIIPPQTTKGQLGPCQSPQSSNRLVSARFPAGPDDRGLRRGSYPGSSPAGRRFEIDPSSHQVSFPRNRIVRAQVIAKRYSVDPRTIRGTVPSGRIGEATRAWRVSVQIRSSGACHSIATRRRSRHCLITNVVSP